MIELGVRLRLLLGQTEASPAPFEVIDSLVGAEVTCSDRRRAGFQLTFAMGKAFTPDFPLLSLPSLRADSRAIVRVVIGGMAETLVDGIITNHQLVVSNEPGQSRLLVTGEDVSLRMALREASKNPTKRSNSQSLHDVLRSYQSIGLMPAADTATTTDKERAVQVENDYEYASKLAQRHGFAFYVEPGPVGQDFVYWGPVDRRGPVQPALTMNMGADTNVESLTFTYDALAPSNVLPPSGTAQAPSKPPSGLNANDAPPLRQEVDRDTGCRDQPTEQQASLAEMIESEEAVTATGQMDTLRYGHILRPGRKVGVRGVGRTFDGTYRVHEVTHSIQHGRYTQSFVLGRPGTGANVPTVKVS